MNTIPHPDQRQTERRTPVRQLLEKLNSLEVSAHGHGQAWRITLASDLNTLLGRAVFHLETTADESDINLARAVIRVVRRVIEFEELRTAEAGRGAGEKRGKGA